MLKVDLNKLKNINFNKNNIGTFLIPYYILKNESGSNADMAIFMGVDFHNLPSTADKAKFIELENECLDYIREQCAGCKLYYKAHPAETDETNYLNLSGFSTVEDKSIGEFYLLKNYPKIKYIFSTHSWASISAYAMGLNSYVFLNMFIPVLGSKAAESFAQTYVSEMPKSALIDDLENGITENRYKLSKDDKFENELKNLLSEKTGDAHFVVIDPMFLPFIISFAKVIKTLAPERKTNLIISKHNRWSRMDMADVSKYFDGVKVFDRPFYSLNPRKVFKSIRTALSVKKISIRQEDIIFGFSNTGFLENCLISFNKKATKISCQMKLNIDWMYGLDRPQDLANDKFKQIPANILYNKVIEPLLGLNKTLYFQYGDGTTFNISRFEKPVNDVYDKVYLFENAKLN